MALKSYKLAFLKKTAKINKESTKKFVCEILKEFGGLSILSSVSVTVFYECIFQINALDDDTSNIAHCGLSLCGEYKEMKCCANYDISPFKAITK